MILLAVVFVACGHVQPSKDFTPVVKIGVPSFQDGRVIESQRDFYVSLDAPVKDISIEVYDLQGNLVSNYAYKFPWTATQTSYALFASNLKPGNDYSYLIVAQKISGKIVTIEGSFKAEL